MTAQKSPAQLTWLPSIAVATKPATVEKAPRHEWRPCCSNCLRLGTRVQGDRLAYRCLSNPFQRRGLGESVDLSGSCANWRAPATSDLNTEWRRIWPDAHVHDLDEMMRQMK